MPSCLLCFRVQATDTYLCRLCQATLKPSARNFVSGQSLYLYTTPLRRLVLRTKINGDQRALRCLCALMGAAPRATNAVAQAAQIISAPSSLWGRMRGRLDLAWFLADTLARQHKVPHHPAPSTLYWRWSKRAQTARHQRSSLHFTHHADNIPTLIIDDLITTGFTLAQVAAALPSANCRFLTLGDAYRGFPHCQPLAIGALP